MVRLFNMLTNLRRWRGISTQTLSLTARMQGRIGSIQDLQHASMSRSTGLSCPTMCCLQWSSIRRSSFRMVAALWLCWALCTNVQVRTKSFSKDCSGMAWMLWKKKSTGRVTYRVTGQENFVLAILFFFILAAFFLPSMSCVRNEKFIHPLC